MDRYCTASTCARRNSVCFLKSSRDNNSKINVVLVGIKIGKRVQSELHCTGSYSFSPFGAGSEGAGEKCPGALKHPLC